MYRKQTIRSAFFIAAAMTVASFSPQSLEAQAFSAQITGSPTWQKGTSIVTWNYSGTPPTQVTQYGVKVVAVSMAGANTTYVLSQAVSFSARQATIAINFTYTQNTALQIVLEDTSGNKITAPYSVTFKAPVISAAPPPVSAPVAGNPALATAACSYVFGQGCTGSYAQFGSYLVAPGNVQAFPTQAAMQAYLINYVGTTSGSKADIINRAAGSQACTNAVNALSGAFTASPNNPQGNGLWNSYTQLISMAPGVVKVKCTVTATPVPTITPAQLTTALTAAFSKLALQAPTATQTSAMAKVTDPNAMEPAVRTYIATDPTLRGQIAVNVYRLVLGTALTPPAATQSQLLSAYGSKWTAADDLYAFLNANKATYLPALAAVPSSLSVKSFLLVSGLGSKCLAVQNGSTAPGTQLVIWACNASAPEQQFTFMGDSSIRPFGNRYGTGLCLDILDAARDGKTMVSGDHPQIFACNGQQNQKFSFANGVIQTSNGWLFDLPGEDVGSWFAGALNVQLYVRNGGDNQRFVAGVALPAGKSVSPIAPNVLMKILPTSLALTSLNGSATIVAQGGGNIVAQGGGNIVAQGGGNIVAQGGGNIVAQGGGNITSAGNDGMVIVPIAAGIVAQGGGN